MTEILTKNKFELDVFQKEAIIHITNGCSIFISAPTGSGKTIIAEYAIMYVLNKNINYQVVYTCPIKSLCNEKYYEFSKKYENTNFTVGLITGDYSINRDANIIICTTEILCNILTNKNKNENSKENIKDIEENIKENIKEDVKGNEKEIKCVIFDEAHYLNDNDRGHVWEKSIILSNFDKECLLVLLSATIGNSNEIMEWLNEINKDKIFKKVSKKERPVPLIEYFIDNTKCRNFKKVNKKSKEEIKETKENNRKDENKEMEISISTNDPNPDQYDLLELSNKSYDKILKYWKKLDDFDYSIKFELQTLCNQIASNEKLGVPCIVFVFSKIKCIEYGEMIETSYVNHEEKKEILNFYDENLKEYLENSQYINLRKIIQNGIAYHHSGLIPKIREVVEFLIKKKLIKFVFSTETFAVGLNFPVKTVLLTSLTKPTENGFRNLTVSEYKQMAGRAGRRFIDNHGNVIIWMINKSKRKNAYLSWSELNSITNGPIDKITSKYTIEPIFILKNIEEKIHSMISFKSFAYYKSKRNEKQEIIIPEKLKKIYELKKGIMEIEKSGLKCTNKQYDKLYKSLNKEDKIDYENLLEEIKNNDKKTDLDYYDDFENYIYEFLKENNFIKSKEDENGSYILTEKGKMSQLFCEINPIIFMNDLEFILKNDIVEILSMFIDDGLKEKEEIVNDYEEYSSIKYFINKTEEKYDNFIMKYPKWNFYPMNYVFLQYWLKDENITLDKASKDFGYDMGIIVKILIKMYQICDELIENLTKINASNMIEIVNNKKMLLIRYPLKLESLYVYN